MSSSNTNNYIFESSARYNKSNVLLELTKEELIFKKKRLFSSELKVVDKFLLSDIIIDKDCVSISQDKELLIIHLTYANVELLFNSIDAARQLKDAIVDILCNKDNKKSSKKKDK